MLIDWFTTGAQLFNFLILVLLLWRFLYRPILRAMDQREERIRTAMKQAEQGRREAESRALELERQTAELEAERAHSLEQARLEVEQWREQAQARAREEIQGLRQAWMERLKHDREVFLERLKAQVADHVVRISEKAMQDLADERLESHMVSAFLKRLEQARDSGLLKDMDGPVIVETGLALTPEAEQTLRQDLERLLPGGVAVEIQEDPLLGPGLTMAAGNMRIGWDLKDYLKELESLVLEELSSKAERQQ